MRIASPSPHRIVAPAFVAVAALLVSACAVRSQHSDSIVARAASVIAPLRDSAALHRAGFFAIGFGGGVKDLTPFQGQHWIQVGRWFVNPAPEVAKPNFLMYLPIGDSLVPIGAAYTRRLEPSIAPPSDLDGDTVEWHSHVFCRAVPGEGNTLADGTDDCKARGGTPGPREIKMVHVWTIANPDGPYAHDNPALPFIAAGLRPPIARVARRAAVRHRPRRELRGATRHRAPPDDSRGEGREAAGARELARHIARARAAAPRCAASERPA